jgi:hypothetical protein
VKDNILSTKRYSEEKIKHLEFLQNIITRMNTNSFQIKTWSITINAALLAVFASGSKAIYLLIPIVPTIIFWFLDTFYLQQERKFRGVYNDVAGLTEAEKKIFIRNFEMPIQKYTKKPYRFFDVFFSKTILFFYCSMVILLLASWLFLSYQGVNLWQKGKCFIASIMGMM